jgi:hypothetical protein
MNPGGIRQVRKESLPDLAEHLVVAADVRALVATRDCVHVRTPFGDD